MERALRILRHALASASLLLMVTTGSPALAEADDEVWQSLVGLALDAFREHRFGEGIEVARAALSLKPHPNLLFNVAWAYHSWGEHCAEAEASFQQLFALCANCEIRGLAEERHAIVREACSSRRNEQTPTEGGFLGTAEVGVLASPSAELATAKSIGVLVLDVAPRMNAVTEGHATASRHLGTRSHLIDEFARRIRENTLLRLVVLDTGREEEFRACAGEPRCYSTRFEQDGDEVDLLLVVSLKDVGELGTFASLTLADVRRSSARSALHQKAVFRASALEALRESLASLRLLFSDAIWRQFGALEIGGGVDAEGARAELTGTGLQCLVPCRLERVPPGLRELRISKEGYLPWTASVVVQSGVVSKTNAELLEVPDSLMSSPWFWAVVTAVVATTAIALSIAIASTPDRPTVECIARTADECNL